MSATSSDARSFSLRRLRPGGRGFRTLLAVERRMFFREPLMLFWGVGFPIVLLVIIGATTGNAHKAEYGGLRYIDVYAPVLFVFVFGIVGLQGMPATLLSYREKGYLRRLSTTPVGAGKLIEAQWVIYTGLCVLSAVILALVARIAFSVHFPSQFIGFLLTLVLTAAAMLAIGSLIASLAKKPRSGQIMGLLFFYPLMFFAGLFGQTQQNFGPTLRTISHCTPLAASVDGIEATMAGHWPPGWCYLCMLLWALAAGRLAIRFFRWE